MLAPRAYPDVSLQDALKRRSEGMKEIRCWTGSGRGRKAQNANVGEEGSCGEQRRGRHYIKSCRLQQFRRCTREIGSL
ncbi:protein of unknown function [Paraburkholderia kururiensis]